MSQFKCDLSAKSERLEHHWEHTVGSGHALLALRTDWQEQLARCRRELGFKYVRFHGILDDDMGTLNCQDDKFVYSFFNTNQIFDFLTSIDMKPFVELSFMPLALSSGGDIVFHYKGNVTPPKDYAQWETLIHKLVQNWTTRYGLEEVSSWFFEVWNEPNLKAFWTGTQKDYFHLYEATHRAVKSVHSILKVGGPATSANTWIPEFLDFCQTNKVMPDFVSTHHYPTDDFGQPGDDTIAQLAASRRSVLRDQAQKAREQARGLPLYYTEWSGSSNPFDALHDQPYTAAFIAKTVMESRDIVEGYSYWTFSDIFEENYFSSVPFHGGFGLMNIYGIPKPAYRAYQLLHHLGDEILPITKSDQENVDVWVTRKGPSLKILSTNWALPRHAVQTEKVILRLDGIEQVKAAYIERIDDTHANAPAHWTKMEKPEYPTLAQVDELEVASALVREPIALNYDGRTLLVEFNLPPQGTACITLERD